MKVVFIAICLLATLQVTAKAKKEEVKSNISYVSMRTGGCNGKCPDYKIELYNSGLVRYSGYSMVKDTGVYEANIGTSQIMSVFHNFEYCQVDTCSNSYTSDQNIAGLKFTFNYKANMYTIRNADQGPKFLHVLATQMDEFLKVSQVWKKVNARVSND